MLHDTIITELFICSDICLDMHSQLRDWYGESKHDIKLKINMTGLESWLSGEEHWLLRDLGLIPST